MSRTKWPHELTDEENTARRDTVLREVRRRRAILPEAEERRLEDEVRRRAEDKARKPS